MTAVDPVITSARPRIRLQLLVGTGVFAVVLLFMLFRSPVFFLPGNLTNVLIQANMLAILATAMTVVMVGGGIDLSPPANVALPGIVGSITMIQFDNVPLGCSLMIFASVLVGTISCLRRRSRSPRVPSQEALPF